MYVCIYFAQTVGGANSTSWTFPWSAGISGGISAIPGMLLNIHIYEYIRIYLCSHLNISVYLSINMNARARARTHTRTNLQTHTAPQTHTYIYTYVCICIYIHMYVCIFVAQTVGGVNSTSWTFPWSAGISGGISAIPGMLLNIQIYEYIRIYLCSHLNISVYLSINMNAHTHTHILRPSG